MTSIQEAQQARTALEQEIADALHQFSVETGLLVTYVNVDHATILGQAPKYVVQIEALRADRRRKPPSLKEQALDQLDFVDGLLRDQGVIIAGVIRRALESLPDPQD